MSPINVQPAADVEAENIHQLALEVRSALEQLDNAMWSSRLRRFTFPDEHCGDASMLLAKYLEEHDCGNFRLMIGDVPGVGSHVWLQREDLVADITADQFEQPPVIVKRNSAWHERLKGEIEDDVADFRACHDELWKELEPIYRELCLRIKPQSQS